MGQKINPTGFRIGVNQGHKATWFANYSAYSEVLKEDYKIRTFFEKKFEPIYSKAGIAKLEIHRKVNQLELIVHAARPKAIAVDTDQTSLITDLKDSLKKLVNDSKQIRVKVLQVTRSENESSLVNDFTLEKSISFDASLQINSLLLIDEPDESIPQSFTPLIIKGITVVFNL